MPCHSIGNLSQCAHGIFSKFRPGLVIDHAVGSEDEAGRAIQRYFRIESHIWPCLNVRAISESLLLPEIVDNVASPIGSDIFGVDGVGHVSSGKHADCMRADAKAEIQTSRPEIDSIVW